MLKGFVGGLSEKWSPFGSSYCNESPLESPGLIGFLPSWWLFFYSIRQILQTSLVNSTRINAIEELLTPDLKNIPVVLN